MSSPSAIGIASALRELWHPVAYSRDLAQGPLGSMLLGEPVVLWRDSEGRPRAFADLCVHRGTALSLGWVEKDEIVCAYHGWRYGTDGACQRIPQLEDPTRIPRKARANAFQCTERYGLVWVALEKPRWPLLDVPELESDAWKIVPTGPFVWNCDASRQVENFTDFGHFPWVHPGLLGDPNRPVVPKHEVSQRDHVLHYEVVRPEAPNSDAFPIFANAEVHAPERRSRYELHLPYTILLRLGWGGEKGMVYFFVSQPTREDRCTGYCIVARNYDLDQPEDVIVQFEKTIFGQDQRVVESQRPEQVPFDLADELHLKFDAVAIAYRRAMKEFGLAYDGATEAE